MAAGLNLLFLLAFFLALFVAVRRFRTGFFRQVVYIHLHVARNLDCMYLCSSDSKLANLKMSVQTCAFCACEFDSTGFMYVLLISGLRHVTGLLDRVITR